jgi:hypothetical protein
VTGGGVPTAARSGSGEELVGERFPGKEGGQVLVQQLQQEERKLLGGWTGQRRGGGMSSTGTETHRRGGGDGEVVPVGVRLRGVA